MITRADATFYDPDSYNGDMQGQLDGDYHAANGFTYDSDGWAYALDVGGTEGNAYYFHVVEIRQNHDALLPFKFFYV